MDEHIDSDAYDLGWQRSHYKRADIKLIMLAMLVGNKPRSSFPKGAREALGIGKTRSIKFKDVEALILKKHEKIKDIFYDGKGLQRMHTESEILIKALLELQKKGVAALPIHDCVLVAEGDQILAQEVMLKALHDVTGQHGKVDVSSL
jgi:bifunctional DNA-binding transcriptional regulator/antitoxin component of YhaV-PrlF toxin-antitoxin module